MDDRDGRSTPLVVAFALLTHFTEVMGVEVTDGQVVLTRGYHGWFGARRLPFADIRRIDLDTTYNNYKRVVARTRQWGRGRGQPLDDRDGRAQIAEEVRSAVIAAGGRLDE